MVTKKIGWIAKIVFTLEKDYMSKCKNECMSKCSPNFGYQLFFTAHFLTILAFVRAIPCG